MTSLLGQRVLRLARHERTLFVADIIEVTVKTLEGSRQERGSGAHFPVSRADWILLADDPKTGGISTAVGFPFHGTVGLENTHAGCAKVPS
jgi:hypothetical protein